MNDLAKKMCVQGVQPWGERERLFRLAGGFIPVFRPSTCSTGSQEIKTGPGSEREAIRFAFRSEATAQIFNKVQRQQTDKPWLTSKLGVNGKTRAVCFRESSERCVGFACLNLPSCNCNDFL